MYPSGFLVGKVDVNDTAGTGVMLKPVAISLKRRFRCCAPDGAVASMHVELLIVCSLWIWLVEERKRVAKRAEDDISPVVY